MEMLVVWKIRSLPSVINHVKSDEFVLDSSLGMNTTKRHLTEDTGMYQMKNIMTFFSVCHIFSLSPPM